jgi:choline dehydrogenase-like flavoprotein
MEPKIMRDQYDVVIVGSGPAGATYARVLKNHFPSAKVLMVEAGPVVSNPPGRHVRTIRDARERVAAQFASQGPNAHPPDYEEQVARALSPSRGRSSGVSARPGTWLLGDGGGMPSAAMSSNVGGMGAHWSGACPWPSEAELSPDIDRVVFADALLEARRLLQVTQQAFDGAPLGAEVRQLLGAHYNPGRSADRMVQPMPLAMELRGDNIRYWTAPGVMLGDLLEAEREGFELRPQTVALHINTHNGRAEGLLLEDRRDGREYEVGARFVVVAADALRSPQLMFDSGIRPVALGHYLNEHTMTTSTIQLHLSLRAATEGARRASEGALDLLAGVSWIPHHAANFPFHGQVTQWDASPIAVDTSFEAWPGSVVECSVFMGKADLRFEDHLEFDDTTPDFFGLPSIKIHYAFTAKDHARLEQAVAEAARMGSLLGEPINGLGPVVLPHGASLHYQGTTRLGSDFETSVVNAASRVWGFENVYVGGNGVIPTAAVCNPTLTTVALAVLGARDLVARL